MAVLVYAGVSMAISKGFVEMLLFEGLQPPEPAHSPSAQEKLDREDTKLFIDEVMRRSYPQGADLERLVGESIDKLNSTSPITLDAIRAELDSRAQALGLRRAAPAAAPSAPAIQAFLQALESRLGAYDWAPGPTKAFGKWLDGPSPLEFPLGKDARINCWEAVLVAAAQAGLVTVGTLRGAYLQKDGAEAVFDLLTRGRQLEEISHLPDQPLANDMRAGDVVMLKGVTGDMHHVVAVVVPDRQNYEKVEVMSLWSGNSKVGTTRFTRTPLATVLASGVTFRYVHL